MEENISQELERKSLYPSENLSAGTDLLNSVHELSNNMGFNENQMNAYIANQAYINDSSTEGMSIEGISNELALKNQRGGY